MFKFFSCVFQHRSVYGWLVGIFILGWSLQANAQNLISVPFNDGFVGLNSASNRADSCYYLSALGWSDVQFAQLSSTNVFVSQGNDIIGDVLITDNLGVEYSIRGYIKWRGPNGGVTTMVFQPEAGSLVTLATSGANGSPTYTIDDQSYIGLTFNGNTLTIGANLQVSGNAATSGLLSELNTYLGTLPSAIIGDMIVDEDAGWAKLVVTLSAASSLNIQLTYSTMDSSALSPGDYYDTTGILSFAPGQLTDTIYVRIHNDNIVELTEFAKVILSNPKNTSIVDNTGIITINDVVSGNIILAVFDTYSVNGSTGGISSYLLNNDSLSGAVVDSVQVNIGVVSIPSGWSIALGHVVVPSGTAAGVYNVIYEICEKADPSNCDTALVTVTVSAPIILANPDGYSVNGYTGGSTGYIMVNDQLSGSALDSADVNVSITSIPTGWSYGNGAMNVPSGTAAGVYNVIYEICEKLNPSNCDTALVTVTITSPVILANPDAYSVSGYTGGSTGYVMVNDQLNGSALDSADVNVSITSIPTGWSYGNGAVNVPSGTAAGVYNIIYEICEKLNPSNCDTALVTVTVSSTAITANAYSFTVVGSIGGLSAYLLSNDILNGVSVDSALVNFTGMSLPSGWTILNGHLSVPSGTSAGVYQMMYEICEKLNPSNCDTALVTVTVISSPIVAYPDAYSVNGYTGGSTGYIMVNDQLNGSALDSADVNLTVTSIPTGWSYGNGSINVPAGTAAGTYNVIYEICEKLNPSNCDTALVTVTITSPIILANPDAYSVNGYTGGTTGYIMVNDQLNGSSLDSADVNLTVTSIPTGWSYGNGSINVPSGTAAGVYNVIYEICEKLNPSNCDTALVTVTISSPVILANPDAYSINGYTGGTTGYVMVNDQLNGLALDSADVNLTVTSIPTGWGYGNGSINVPSGTAAGVYNIIYQICEKLNPSNCDTALVTVTVTSPVVLANPDAYSVNGYTGGTTGYMMVNDQLNGSALDSADVNVSITSIPTGWSYGNGTVNVPSGTAAGVYNIIYEICEKLNPSNCDTALVTVTITSPVILANPDVYSVNGYTGGSTGYIMVNDQLNGLALDSADVNLTVTSIPTGWSYGNGTVNVPSGTAAGVYNIIYEICEKLNPSNCDTALVTVTITSPVILANPDTYSVNGYTGGTTGYIMVNDQLNGSSLDSADVNLTVTSIPTGWSYGNGTVNVPSGTAAGVYNIIYEICEKLNPSNCDTALVTVTITSPIILANPDAYSVNGYTGGTTGYIMVNDLLNGSASDSADVNVTITSIPTGWSYGNGTVNVPSGTAAGVYNIIYEICEKLNPSNCDTALVTVTITSPVILANPDAYSVNGYTGGTTGYIMVNDQLNGLALDSADVNLTVTSIPTGWGYGNGSINVPVGTAAGTYNVIYEICEKLNPSNCDTALVTVTITSPVILANPDAYSVNGYTGGTTGYIMVNDELNGSSLDSADVNLTVTSIPTGWSYGNGSINVPSGTAAGVYNVIYEICEKLNPSNCDTALVTVTITSPVILANPDAYSVNGYTGGTTGYIMVNDELNGSSLDSADVNLTVTSIPTGWSYGNGSINVPSGTAAGVYNVIYEICEKLNPSNCDTALVTVTVLSPLIVAVNDSATVNGYFGFSSPLQILQNDTLNGVSASGVAKTVLLVNPLTGSTLQSNGNLTLPKPIPSGTYLFTYYAYDTLNVYNTDTAQVFITSYVLGPDAQDDVDTTMESTPVTIDVLQNDSDPDNNLDPSSLNLIYGGRNGSSSLTVNHQIEYTPNAGWFGVDTLTYAISDSGAVPILWDTAHVYVYVLQNIQIQVISQNNILCYGDTTGEIELSIHGGVAPYAVSWNVNAPNPMHLHNLGAGNYTVTITDAQGRVLQQTYTISQPASPIQLTSTIMDVSCYGEWDGGIQVSVSGGTGPYAYQWSIPGQTNQLDSISAGFYWIQVTDANGCVSVDSFEVIQPEILEVVNWNIEGVHCISETTGSIEIFLSGGTYPYTYSWSNGATTASIQDLTGGTYQVEITDANGCQVVYDFVVPYETENCSDLVVIPQGFSPGDDGRNDYFIIEGLENFPDNHFQVFNRWGSLVYEVKGYQNDFKGEANRGLRVNNDFLLPSGTYFYFLTLEPNSKPITGYIFISR